MKHERARAPGQSRVLRAPQNIHHEAHRRGEVSREDESTSRRREVVERPQHRVRVSFPFRVILLRRALYRGVVRVDDVMQRRAVAQIVAGGDDHAGSRIDRKVVTVFHLLVEIRGRILDDARVDAAERDGQRSRGEHRRGDGSGQAHGSRVRRQPASGMPQLLFLHLDVQPEQFPVAPQHGILKRVGNCGGRLCRTACVWIRLHRAQKLPAFGASHVIVVSIHPHPHPGRVLSEIPGASRSAAKLHLG